MHGGCVNNVLSVRRSIAKRSRVKLVMTDSVPVSQVPPKQRVINRSVPREILLQTESRELRQRWGLIETALQSTMQSPLDLKVNLLISPNTAATQLFIILWLFFRETCKEDILKYLNNSQIRVALS